MLPFKGWMFPDVPADARLHYVRGEARCPDAGGGFAHLAGDDEFGGTGYMFRKNGLDGPEWRARLLAVGIGVKGWRRPLCGGASIAASGSLNLLSAANSLVPNTGGGYGAALTAAQQAGTAGVHLKELVITCDIKGAVLQNNGRTVAYLQSGPTVLRDVIVDANWQVVNATLGAIFVGLHAIEEDPGARLNVGMGLVTRPVDGDGDVQGTQYNSGVAGRAFIRRPQLLSMDERPTLRPVAPGDLMTRLEEGHAFGVMALQEAAGIVPKFALCVAEMAVAVWREKP